METRDLETNIWYKVLKVILYALLLTPLWFLSIFLFPFITTKVLYLRILVEVALLIYLLLAMAYPQIRPRWNWLLKAVWIYMGVIVIASLFGVNIGKSLMGTIERGEGVVTILHYVVYFTILTSVFRTGRDWYRYLMSAVGVITAVGIYGLLQLAGASFVVSGQGARISGTIGNAAFFAAFMLFAIFLSIYLLYHPRTREGTALRKIYLWASLLVTVIATYNSQTRGALVALVAAGFIYGLFLAVKSKRGRIRLVAGVVLLALVLSTVGVYLGRDSGFVKSQNTLHRLATISPTDITTQSRFDSWGAAWAGWKDRFILGYGYENYNIAFNQYFPARIFKDQGSQIWFDRAHNIVFDLGGASGVVGLISYLAIFVIAVGFLFRLFRKSKETDDSPDQIKGLRWEMPVVLVLGLLAYFIQNIFVFDTHATYLIFFVILAYVAFLRDANLPQKGKGSEVQGWRPNFFVALILGTLTFLTIYFINFEPAFANYHTVKGILAARTGQFRQVQPSFEKALSYGTYMDEEIRQRLVDFANEAVASGQLSSQEQAEIYELTIAELQKSIAGAPRDVKNYLFLMTVYNRSASFGPDYPDRVLALSEEAILLSPTRPQIYFETGQAYFNKDQPALGLEQFQKALDLNPETKESHFNLAVASALAGRDDVTQRELQFIADHPSYTVLANEYVTLARAYRQAGQMDKVVEFYQKAAEVDSDDPQRFAQLAAVYGELCNLEGARQAVDKAIEIDSGFAADGKIFLLQLEQNCSQ